MTLASVGHPVDETAFPLLAQCVILTLASVDVIERGTTMGWSRTRIDDLDGTVARTFTFGVDGKAYVLDLGERNAKRIEDILRPFLVVAHEYGQLPLPPEDYGMAVEQETEAAARPASRARRTPTTAQATLPTPPTSKRRRTAAAALANAKSPKRVTSRRSGRNHPDGRPRDLASVRAWARNNGYSVQNTGRIPNEILEASDSKTPASV
jgi:hypothetical protein